MNYDFTQWDYPSFHPINWWDGKLDNDTPSVYIFMNIIDCKKYVGFTVNLKRRIIAHLSLKGGRSYFHSALKKYGPDNFWLATIPVGNEYLAKELEMGLISKWKTHKNSSRGYNMTSGGQGSVGYKHTEEALEKMRNKIVSEETKQKLREINLNRPPISEETRQKLSEAGKGRIVSEETRQKLRRLSTGRKHTEETLEKMRGRVVSKETRQKLREANLGKKQLPEVTEKLRKLNTGRKHTEEAKRKISEAKLGEKNYFYGKHLSEEHRNKIAKGNTGKVRTEEAKRKMSEAKLGKKFTEEHKRNISKGKKGKKLSPESLTKARKTRRINRLKKQIEQYGDWFGFDNNRGKDDE